MTGTAARRGVPARAADEFTRLHGHAPAGVWSAPGRVNLIGEHTDYNDGFVLPFALPFRIAVAARARTDGMLAVTTVGDDGSPAACRARGGGRAGAGPGHRVGRVPGRGELGVASTRGSPPGPTWSSPATCRPGPACPPLMRCSARRRSRCSALAGTELDEPGAPSRAEVAAWVQRSENDFVGVPTGLLDQTASLCCVEAHVLFLDVRSGEMEQVPFDTAAAGLDVLVIDTRAQPLARRVRLPRAARRLRARRRTARGAGPARHRAGRARRRRSPGCPTSCARSSATWSPRTTAS